jgi:hypothetical protein
VVENEGQELKLAYAKTTATAFLNTYLGDDGFGHLGFLQAQRDDRFLVLDPNPPSPLVFGVALLDYWKATYGDQLTINLDDLSAEGGLGDIFMIGAGRISQYLRLLQDEGYVEVYRYAPPYQVVLLKTDERPLLEKLYVLDAAG